MATQYGMDRCYRCEGWFPSHSVEPTEDIDHETNEPETRCTDRYRCNAYLRLLSVQISENVKATHGEDNVPPWMRANHYHVEGCTCEACLYFAERWTDALGYLEACRKHSKVISPDEERRLYISMTCV